MKLVCYADVDYCERTAAEVAVRYRAMGKNVWRRQFQESFAGGGRVLDVGSGSGRVSLLAGIGI